MRDISKAANLSTTYTNHCVRATACTVLDSAGVETRHIMYFTAHKNEASVRSYTNKLTSDQSHGMSGILSKSLGYQTEHSEVVSVEIDRNFDVATDTVGSDAAPSPSQAQNTIVPLASRPTPADSSIAAISNTHNQSAASLFNSCTFSGPVNVNIIHKN